MSLILEGIDLPKKGTIKLEIEPDGTVWAEGKDWQSYTESAIQIPKDHGRLADLDDLSARMYHETFNTDTPLQRWDSGCWIRYKMFENCRDSTPIIFKAEEY